ncbi:MAG: hypothetical protein UW79_C0022G0018 [Candidatus Yanofskybacteria bacterium GW2011_GWA2_44_9]|uniref:VIT family protein n=2 Tax=Candidatus Yanofskyibacteriota TaxID=1752733 RepID=A0A0G1KCH8_9BACT|nr:MAG: hypothetical protein UW79_C0022G0018 [Candidatus Yanofskybacteria bacterium GW2011_GWA2_44_9]
MSRKAMRVSYFRNFIFGVEDGLVSTVGLLSGIAIADVPSGTILLTGIVLVFVEAFSMAAGSFLSEYSAEGYAEKVEEPTKRDFVAGTVMFFSYFISGFIPLSPYMIMSTNDALGLSVVLSVATLFILGVVGAKMSGTGIMRNGFRMAFVGGIAITVGMIAGKFISNL